jgi:hypothetical protein
MNGYDVDIDEWLWCLRRWMIMKLFMMNDYELVYDD